MNETLEKVMIFINENTNILIGICLFLIFVLVAYLIDNSIKSKKAMKKMQEKEESKETEIPTIPITHTYADVKSKEVSKEEIKEEPVKETVNAFEDAIVNNTSNVELDTPKEEVTEAPSNTIFEAAIENNNNNIVNEIENNDVSETIISMNKPKVTEETNTDVVYKNDKKLSDILLGGLTNDSPSKDFNDITNNVENDNIFSSASEEANVTPEKVESKVEIELNNTELDNIMKKLNNGNAISEDNYTNIF